MITQAQIKRVRMKHGPRVQAVYSAYEQDMHREMFEAFAALEEAMEVLASFTLNRHSASAHERARALLATWRGATTKEAKETT